MERLWAPVAARSTSSRPDDATDCVFCVGGDFASPVPTRPTRCSSIARTQTPVVMLNKYPYAPGHLLDRSLESPLRGVRRVWSAEEAGRDPRAGRTRNRRARRARRLPHGFNVGWNLGRSAGAGNRRSRSPCTLCHAGDWRHKLHACPRRHVRVMPEHLADTRAKLLAGVGGLAQGLKTLGRAGRDTGLGWKRLQ